MFVPDTARPNTGPFRPPLPNGTHAVLFHAARKWPPAYKLLLDEANAYTAAETPEPRAVQLFPFHLATPLMPPRKSPPAWTSPSKSVNVRTVLLSPEPNALQLAPSHFATLIAVIPPALVKLPPTYTTLPDVSRESALLLTP